MMSPGRGRGFTLLELMITMTIILVLATLALPSYRTSILRAREAVLRDNLFTLRSLIDQFTLDKKMAPQSLEDLVEEGYLRKIPEFKDPRIHAAVNCASVSCPRLLNVAFTAEIFYVSSFPPVSNK